MAAAKTVIPSLEALPDFVEVALGPSEWVAVEQARIDAFAAATDDRQWIHCDVDRASRESPWKSTIAHGYLTLSLIPGLLDEILSLEGWSTAVNSGIDKLRFQAPVPSGSRVRLRAQIEKARRMPGGGVRVTFGLRMEAEGEPKPALTASVHYVYLP
jgi:acyl dehydratase